MRRLNLLVCFISVLLFSQIAVFAQPDTFKLDQLNLELVVNSDSKTVTATALNPDTFPDNAEITWSGHAGFVEIQQKLSADRKMIVSTFKAIKAVSSQAITAAFGDTSVGLKLRVDPEVSMDTLKFSPELSASEKLNGIAITKGGTKRISLTQKDSSAIPSNALSVSSDSQNVASASISNNQVVIKAADVGATVIRVKAYGKEISPVAVNVTAGVDLNTYRNKTISVKKGKDLVLNTIFGDDTAKLDFSQTDNPNVALLSTDKTKITGVKIDTTSFTVSLKDDAAQSASVNITVEANPEKIVYSGLGNRPLLVGERLPVSASVEGNGERIRGATIDLVSSKPDCISVVKKPDNNFTVMGEQAGCKAVLTFSTTIPGATVEDETIHLNTNVVGGFRYLKIRLDMMDNQTARDLFGKKAVDEYFIAKVRLFNRIRKDDLDFGNSILVYSESLEAKVAVEWRTEGDTASQWQTLTKDDATKKWFPNGLTNPDPDQSKHCEIIEQQHMFIPYRPLTFEMVLNTQERRDSRTSRSRILRTLHGASSLASFITSIAVPGAGSDLPVALEKFRNLFIPSYEKLFPSQNEIQRQNITSMAMRPLEEIPFGSDITRVLFFPKRKIAGVLLNQKDQRKTELRISAVSVADACAEAGVIKKLPQTP